LKVKEGFRRTLCEKSSSVAGLVVPVLRICKVYQLSKEKDNLPAEEPQF
jgi:hypothetical protein